MDETAPPTNPTSVKDFGVFYDQNWQYRRRMEDAHFLKDGFSGNPNMGLFAVYDGHGGKEAAVYSSENLHKVLEEELKSVSDVLSNHEAVLDALKRTYAATDEKMKASVPAHHGCTAVTAFIAGPSENRHLYVANVGDARAVLCRGGKALRLTQDHTASSEVEAKRIQDAGGFIINGRVNGQIIITRSLGDHLMKEFIINEPHVYHTQLTGEDTHLIVACDGLWDVLEDQQAIDFVLANNSLSATDISKKLLIKALEDGSTDNLSVIVIKL